MSVIPCACGNTDGHVRFEKKNITAVMGRDVHLIQGASGIDCTTCDTILLDPTYNKIYLAFKRISDAKKFYNAPALLQKLKFSSDADYTIAS